MEPNIKGQDINDLCYIFVIAEHYLHDISESTFPERFAFEQTTDN